MQALARAGGGGNVTVPHKEIGRAGARTSATDWWRRSARATRSGLRTATGWSATTPTCDGLLAALDTLEPPDGPWLIAGTGGSARAAVAAAARRGAAVAVRLAVGHAGADVRERGLVVPERGSCPAAECRVIDQRHAARPVARRRAAARHGARAERGRRPRPGVLGRARRPGSGRCARPASAPPTDAPCWWRRAPRPSSAGFPGADAPAEVMRAAVDAALR